MRSTEAARPVWEAIPSAPQDIVTWLRRHPAMRPRRSQGAEHWLSTGVESVDDLLGGGFPCAALTEIVGRRSSGRTALALRCMREATRQGNAVAWIDGSDSLDPRSLESVGVIVDRFLWVRPSGRDRLKQAMQASDVILRAGGFAALVLDLSGFRYRSSPGRTAWWVRLSRCVEASEMAGLILAHSEGSFCSNLRLFCERVPGDEYVTRIEVTRRRHGNIGGVTTLSLGTPMD